MSAGRSDDASRAALDEFYRQIFEEDKRGIAILEDLHRRFVRAPNPNDFTQAGMLRTFVQTHQREVLEYVIRCCNRARGVQDEPPPTNGDDHALS